MPVEIHLSNRFSPWKHIETDRTDCYLKGYVFVDNHLTDDEEFASCLSRQISGYVHDRQTIAGLFRHLNGGYAFVVDAPDYVLCAVDRIRSIPLFYSETQGRLIISDEAQTLKRSLHAEPNDRHAAEFLVTGFVTGRETLLNGIKQVQAGEYLFYDKRTETPFFSPHFRYGHEEFFQIPEEQMIEQLDQVYTNVFARLLTTTTDRGKHLVVPLSGGLDSRILVAMLKKFGVEDMTCFTYGIRNNRESMISREVADMLGYPWYFVEYTRQKWGEIYDSPEMSEFLDYCGNFASLPHIQDLPAVRELKRREIIPEDSVIVPGHGADVLAGCKIPPTYDVDLGCTAEDAVHFILADHHSYWDWGNDQMFTELFEENVRSVIPSVCADDSESGANAIEFFDYRERQAKYIVNSVRTYEYYGYEWRLPFWDNEFLEFFMKVPLRYRKRQALYKRFAQKKVFAGDLKRLKYIECTTKVSRSVSQRWIDTRNKFRLVYDRLADRGIYALWYRDLQSLLLRKNVLMTDIDTRYPLVRTMVMRRGCDPSIPTIISLLNLEYLIQCTDISDRNDDGVKSRKECIRDINIPEYLRKITR